MNFYCCGVKYSTTDPKTYLYIERFKTKKPIAQSAGCKKIHHEDVYFLECVKNDCYKTFIYSYTGEKSNRANLYEITEIKSKKDSLKFKEKQLNLKNLISNPLPIPTCKIVPQSKTIPFVYGKIEDSTTQRRRYINETGYADCSCIEQPVKIYTHNK